MIHLLVTIDDDLMTFEEIEHFGEMMRHIGELSSRFMPDWGLSAINLPEGNLDNYENDDEGVMNHIRTIVRDAMEPGCVKATA